MILFLTGTIHPIGVTHTALTDPIIREKHYCDAINFYLTKTNLKIVFVENSNRSIAGKFLGCEQRLEFLTFDGNKNSVRGKGFGEMEIFEYFLEHSKFLCDDNVFVKITGRYKVKNINHFLRYYTAKSNLTETMIDLKRKKKYCDSRFFIGSKEFASQFLISNKYLINDSNGYYFEHALAKATLENMKVGNKNLLFPTSAHYEGVYATDNLTYRTTIFKKLLKNTYYKLKAIYYVYS